MSNNDDTPTKEPHDCYDKEKRIRDKTGIQLDPTSIHDVITIMCINLNFQSADEFNQWLNTSTKETVSAEVSKAKKALLYSLNTKKKKIAAYQ